MRDQVIGIAMRAYRRSPLYPTWGQRLAAVLSRLPGPKSAVREIDGVTYELDLREVIDSSLYYSGTFEADTEKAISGLLRPGMVALDIGANVGYHTFRIARGVAPGGRVVAVEPMSQARGRLERNMALNPSLDNIVVSSVALSDASGTEAISFRSSFRLDGHDDAVVEQVRLVTLDELVTELGLPSVDFLKIDVDGFELKLFRGANRTLSTWRPRLVFELWPAAVRRQGDDPLELIEILARHGYVVTTENGSPVDIGEVVDRAGEHSVNLVATAAGS